MLDSGLNKLNEDWVPTCVGTEGARRIRKKDNIFPGFAYFFLDNMGGGILYLPLEIKEEILIGRVGRIISSLSRRLSPL
jgi:hypothetical protein